jgi:hypothetical protein
VCSTFLLSLLSCVCLPAIVNFLSVCLCILLCLVYSDCLGFVSRLPVCQSYLPECYVAPTVCCTVCSIWCCFQPTYIWNLPHCAAFRHVCPSGIVSCLPIWSARLCPVSRCKITPLYVYKESTYFSISNLQYIQPHLLDPRATQRGVFCQKKIHFCKFPNIYFDRKKLFVLLVWQFG